MNLTRKSFFILSCLFISAIGFAKDSYVPELVEIMPDRIFSPQGFDDNDKVEVIIDGKLRSSCYKIGPTDFRVEEGKIFVRQYAYYYRGFCMQMESSYTTPPISLGILKAGTYQIVSEKGNEQKVTAGLPIGQASTEAADEHLYAPVSEAQLTRVSENETTKTKTYALTLKGTFDSACAKLDESKFVIKQDTAAGVIEVLPILERADQVCTPQTKPYEATVKLKDIAPGRYLVHIRSLSGASFNLVRDL